MKTIKLFGSLFVFFFALNIVNAQFCTMQYDPVCAEKQVQCVSAPCEPILKTYSNACFANLDKAKVLYKGECKTKISDLPEPLEPVKETPAPAAPSKEASAIDPMCKSWDDGCNICSRKEPGGNLICTMRACLKDDFENAEAKCLSYFDESAYKEDPEAEFEKIKREFIKEFKEYPPIPMDEVGEIKPIRVIKNKENARESLENTNANNEQNNAIDELDWVDMYPYDAARIFVNLPRKYETNQDILHIEGIVDLSKSNPWAPFEGDSGTVSLKTIDGKLIERKLISFGPDWMEKANKEKALKFNVDFDLSKLKDASYLLEFKNQNPSGLKQYDSKFNIIILLNRGDKAGQKGKSVNKLDLAYKKYQSYGKAVKVFKENSNIVVEIEKQGRLFGLISVSYIERVILDEQNLNEKQRQKPWWSFLVF